MSAKKKGKKNIRYQSDERKVIMKKDSCGLVSFYLLAVAPPVSFLIARTLTDSKERQDIDNESCHPRELAHDPRQTLFVRQEQLLVPFLSRQVS